MTKKVFSPVKSEVKSTGIMLCSVSTANAGFDIYQINIVVYYVAKIAQGEKMSQTHFLKAKKKFQLWAEQICSSW